MDLKAEIFNIEDFSVDDGPGLRTVIFFKGCPLRCKWCHNPESLEMREQILIYDDKCIGCGECFKICPEGAHSVGVTAGDVSATEATSAVQPEPAASAVQPEPAAGAASAVQPTQTSSASFASSLLHIIDNSKCKGCMTCVENCFSGSLVKVGERIDVETIKRRILRNKGYFEESKGGVTFSGGECMLQIDALEELLKFCKENGVHTAVDTCGNIPWASYERVIPYADVFLYDIKAMDPEVHRQCTGVDNRRILENFKKLHDRGCKLLVRVPYIPGYNDGELPAIAEFLSQYPEIKAELLGYHTLGVSKYKALRMPYIEAYSPTTKEMDALKAQYGFLP